MLGNHLKITYRTLLNHKLFSLINIAGLAIGVACTVLILVYLQDEFSYDSFHNNADHIYRIVCEAKLASSEFEAPVAPAPMAATLINEFPEVVHAARLWTFSGRTPVRYRDQRFVEDRFYYADSTIFDVFTFRFVHGSPQTALREPNSVVLTQSVASRYFGFEYPVGRSLIVGKGMNFLVTAVIADLPHNSHFHFDFLAALNTLGFSKNTFWMSNSFHTYIVLQDQFPPGLLEAKLPMIVRKYAGPQIQMAMGITYDDFLATTNRLTYSLQPLKDIHLYSNLQYEIEPNGNALNVLIFIAIALFMLLIACVNFANLSTARSVNRAKEVGMRKVFGSHRIELIRQFLTESFFITLLAFFLAMFLIYSFLPIFNELTGKQITIDYFGSIEVIAGLLALMFSVGILAGGYPAFFLSSFRTNSVLKDKVFSARGGGNSRIRSGLVIIQLTLSVLLVIMTIVANNQLRFIRARDLGFESKDLLVLKDAGLLGTQQSAFKTQVAQSPAIIGVTASSSLPGGLFSQIAYQPEGSTTGQSFVMSPMFVDHDFFKIYKIKVAKGRDFSDEFSTDSTALQINGMAARTFGWKDPLGKRIVPMGVNQDHNQDGRVIGIVDDFHFESLHQPVAPMVLGVTQLPLPFLSIRIQPGQFEAAISSVKGMWLEFLPDQPFEYSFLEDDLGLLYRVEEKLTRTVGYFTMLAITIACLGLFGLASYTAYYRSKEIGVRKVFGATTQRILGQLSMDFAKLILISLAFATPLAYFMMDRWLQAFAYRVEIEWWVFLLSGSITSIVVLLAVIYQTVTAASTNPVEVLRHE